MSITSFTYFVFVALTLLMYYFTPLRVRQWILLAASVVFYVWGCGVVLFSIMCAIAAFVWFVALLQEQKGGNSDVWKKRITIITIIALCMTLIIFKDLPFFTANFRYIFQIFGHYINIAPPEWVAPIGISYFTLMLIGYTIDVHTRKIAAEKNILKVVAFTCWFPQMVLGPLTRYKDMKSELFEGHKFNYAEFTFGLQRMCWGLFKKLVISERLALIVSAVYGNYESLGGGYVFIGAIAYVGQLYTDFSGAIDIIIGVSQMFGVKLQENFRQPFASRSLAEFWRRWHITLGAWVRDYIYIPLGGNRKGLVRQICNMGIVWFITGFWHGGSWKWIFGLGVISFTIIAGGKLLQPYFDRVTKLLRINTKAWSWHLFQRVRTFAFFTISIATTRAESLTDALKFWKTLFTDMENSFAAFMGALSDKSIYMLIGIDEKDTQILMISLLILLAVSTLQQNGSIRERIANQNIAFRWLIYLGMFAAIIVFGMYGVGYNPTDFIYGGF